MKMRPLTINPITQIVLHLSFILIFLNDCMSIEDGSMLMETDGGNRCRQCEVVDPNIGFVRGEKVRLKVWIWNGTFPGEPDTWATGVDRLPDILFWVGLLDLKGYVDLFAESHIISNSNNPRWDTLYINFTL
jgi:hypothetical protein